MTRSVSWPKLIARSSARSLEQLASGSVRAATFPVSSRVPGRTDRSHPEGPGLRARVSVARVSVGRTTTIEVNTTRYEFPRGKKPRGTGWWAFDLIRHHRDGTRTSERVMRVASYGEARKYALVRARAVGAATVVVVP